VEKRSCIPTNKDIANRLHITEATSNRTSPHLRQIGGQRLNSSRNHDPEEENHPIGKLKDGFNRRNIKVLSSTIPRDILFNLQTD